MGRNVVIGPLLVVAMASGLYSTSALAYGGRPDGRNDSGDCHEPAEGRTPPPEAFAACKNRSAGDAVSLTTPRGDTLSAVCRQMNNALVAVPDRMPGPSNGESPRDPSGSSRPAGDGAQQ